MREKIKLIIAMFIVGTIGIFIHYIALPSSIIAACRAIIGTIFIFIVMLLKKQSINFSKIKSNMLLFILSGAALSFNWIFLFEAYQYTSVAIATLCYYMAPVFVILLSPIVLKESLNRKKIICTIFALLGAILISGVIGNGLKTDFRGIGFGLLAALLYCCVILLNKKITGLSNLEVTFCQLLVATVIMLPYIFLTQNVFNLSFTTGNAILLIIVGIVHTGIVYLLFFSAINKLPAQTSSVLSYIDPITAILLSTLLLSQPLSFVQICGSVLILASTFINEISSTK